MNLLAFIQAILGGQRSGSAGTQKRFLFVLLGIFLALFGVSVSGVSGSILFVFFGLLFLIPNGLTSIFFNRHYERLNLSAYLQSAVLPAFVALNILLKIKGDVKNEFGQVWDVVLISLGVFTFLYSSLLALLKTRLKSVLINLSQAWIGLSLFLLVIDGGSLNHLTLTAISIGCVSAVILLNLASQLGPRYVSFVKVATLGLPGMIWFTVYFFAIKMTMSLNVVWLLVFGLGYFLQALTLIAGKSVTTTSNFKMIRMRFWITVAIQAVSGVGLYWLEMGGIK